MIHVTEKQIRDRQTEILAEIAEKTKEYKGLQSLLPTPRKGSDSTYGNQNSKVAD